MKTMHFSQKALSFVVFLMLVVSSAAQAKRVVERPYFFASNNHKLEIERVTLDKKATVLDVKIYQASGKVSIDSHAVLAANGATYAYLGSPQLPKGVFVKVPECGYVSATLRFKPMPETTREFDFREVSDNSGWNIYGVRLDGRRPQNDIPQHLLQQAFDKKVELPSTDLNLGKTVVNVRLVGYKPEYGTTLLLDFWNTWCMPCRAAMSAIRPLKEQLTDVVYVYIADASSPVGKWGEMIKTISGVHVRLTEEQADALSDLYHFSGIPTYFVVNKEGKITYQTTSFPGVDKLREVLKSE